MARDPYPLGGSPTRAGGFSPGCFIGVQIFAVILIILFIVVAILGSLAGPGN